MASNLRSGLDAHRLRAAEMTSALAEAVPRVHTHRSAEPPPGAGERTFSPQERWRHAMRTGRMPGAGIAAIANATLQLETDVELQLLAAGVVLNG